MSSATMTTENTFKFALVSPERILMSEDIKMVTVPGDDGDFGVLPNHAPLLSSLRDGIAVILRADGTEEKVFVSGGFADVNDNVCTILAEDAAALSDLDRAALEAEREKTSEHLKMVDEEEHDDLIKRTRLVRKLERIETKLALIA
ncbi:MAG: ATP synthase F1 subunit epsilon [Pseudomonadota bacterium]|nr:ATP synthase F1 subunit epsilon [Pseudomonadota bacterium]QKK05049.1 MAG: ATP synthase F1 subunit epsilon [Pseudomonadota bacterium]